jgi:hypothetical protein
MKRPILPLVLALFLLPLCLLSYRIVWLKYPLLPSVPGETWQLLIKARVQPGVKDIRIEMGFPVEHAGRMLVEEQITSGSLNFDLLRQEPNRIGTWSGTPYLEEEEISYRTLILIRPQRTPKPQSPVLEIYPANFGKEEQALAEHLAARWSRQKPSPRIRAVAKTALGEWGSPPPEDRYLRGWKIVQEKYGRLKALLMLLRAADLPSRVVEGLRLVEGIRTTPLTWVEVWNGNKWEILWPGAGEIDKNSAAFLPLATGGLPSLRVTSGEISEAHWSLSRQIISKWKFHFERIQRTKRFLDRWSLFRLPPEFQKTFRILLLVPIGVLIISVLRNLVGFPTFGIFMPVLMALAFRNTGLAYGLGIFAGILLIGYIVRRGLDKLRLLLVPRMALILTLVIICFTVLALVGHKLGLREFMAVGLLPFVILTMVIERFYVLVEEAGIREGLRTAAGSAAVAVISYQIISWEPLQLTFFIYPELLAPIAAVQILLGRYTGYRLSELFRFRTLRKTS